jgi:hypothetical protein
MQGFQKFKINKKGINGNILPDRFKKKSGQHLSAALYTLNNIYYYSQLPALLLGASTLPTLRPG